MQKLPLSQQVLRNHLREAREEEDFNEPEKGVRELQVSFSDSGPTPAQMKKEIILKRTLYHAHTAHQSEDGMIIISK